MFLLRACPYVRQDTKFERSVNILVLQDLVKNIEQIFKIPCNPKHNYPMDAYIPHGRQSNKEGRSYSEDRPRTLRFRETTLTYRVECPRNGFKGENGQNIT